MKELEVEMFMVGLELLRRSLPKIGPYLLMAIVLPGGPVIALLTYLYRRRVNERMTAGSLLSDSHPTGE